MGFPSRYIFLRPVYSWVCVSAVQCHPLHFVDHLCCAGHSLLRYTLTHNVLSLDSLSRIVDGSVGLRRNHPNNNVDKLQEVYEEVTVQ